MLVQTDLRTRPVAAAQNISYDPSPPLTATNVQGALDAIAAEAYGVRIQKILTAAGPYTALPTDEILIVKQTVGAPMTINVDWSARSSSLTVLDGKGDADINNITIVPSAGQTQMSVVDYPVVINGIGGSVNLRPLADHTGAY